MEFIGPIYHSNISHLHSKLLCIFTYFKCIIFRAQILPDFFLLLRTFLNDIRSLLSDGVHGGRDMCTDRERDNRRISNTNVRCSVHLQVRIHYTPKLTRHHRRSARLVVVRRRVRPQPPANLRVRRLLRARLELAKEGVSERLRGEHAPREAYAADVRGNVHRVRVVVRVHGGRVGRRR